MKSKFCNLVIVVSYSVQYKSCFPRANITSASFALFAFLQTLPLHQVYKLWASVNMLFVKFVGHSGELEEWKNQPQKVLLYHHVNVRLDMQHFLIDDLPVRYLFVWNWVHNSWSFLLVFSPTCPRSAIAKKWKVQL